MILIVRKIILSAFIIVCIISCKDKILTGDVNCDECYTEGYDKVDIELKVTINEEYPVVNVLLYKGKSIENGEFIDTFICDFDSAYNVYRNFAVGMKSDEDYAAKAVYKNNKRTVYVVDAIKQKMKRVTDACDQECWVSVNDVMELELAY